jgi:hypothetical protein
LAFGDAVVATLGLAGALAVGVFGFAGALGLAGVLAGAVTCTTSGIGVVAAGSGILYGAEVFSTVVTACCSCFVGNPNKRLKKSNIFYLLNIYLTNLKRMVIFP